MNRSLWSPFVVAVDDAAVSHKKDTVCHNAAQIFSSTLVLLNADIVVSVQYQIKVILPCRAVLQYVFSADNHSWMLPRETILLNTPVVGFGGEKQWHQLKLGTTGSREFRDL